MTPEMKKILIGVVLGVLIGTPLTILFSMEAFKPFERDNFLERSHSARETVKGWIEARGDAPAAPASAAAPADRPGGAIMDSLLNAVPEGSEDYVMAVNPMSGNAEAIAKGMASYAACAACHGQMGEGNAIAPSLVDDQMLGQPGNLSDYNVFMLINYGTTSAPEWLTYDGRETKGGMPGFKDMMSPDDVWAVMAYIDSISNGG